MCFLLETIKIENGEIRNLKYHNLRFNKSRKEKFGISAEADLSEWLTIPTDMGSGVYRCRMIYGDQLEKIEFHTPKTRTIRSLKLVHSQEIDYPYKYADRKQLESLFAQRGNCDEVLIVKNGFVTDTSISNIVFRQDDGSWVTPNSPLLSGTMRMYLLDTGQISESVIRPEILHSFTGAKMINCMMDIDESPLIEMDRIST